MFSVTITMNSLIIFFSDFSFQVNENKHIMKETFLIFRGINNTRSKYQHFLPKEPINC